VKYSETTTKNFIFLIVLFYQGSTHCLCSQGHIPAGWRLEARPSLPTSLLSPFFSEFKVKVTLRLMVSQSVSLGVEPYLGLMTRYLLLFDSYGLALWGALSDKRKGLSFVYADGPCQRSLSRVRVPWDSRPYFTVSDLRLSFRRLLRLHTG
jgi:hypothetical protein